MLCRGEVNAQTVYKVQCQEERGCGLWHLLTKGGSQKLKGSPGYTAPSLLVAGAFTDQLRSSRCQ